jgi:hypothetical protein
MVKLNAVIAIEKDVKNHAHKIGSAAYHLAQKPAVFEGIYKTYRPKEEGDDLPPERKHAQYKVHALLEEVQEAHAQLIDVTIQKDLANASAKADLVVEGHVIYKGIPVTTLLFLEKQLTDYRSFVSALPVLDIAEEWVEDKNDAHFYRSAIVATHRTKKVQKGLTLYHATEHHPAQTAIITEDIIAGHWETEKVSGAIPKKRKDRMVKRIDLMILAVKTTREEANDTDAGARPKLAHALHSFLNG